MVKNSFLRNKFFLKRLKDKNCYYYGIAYSDSMEPLISSGDKIKIKQCSYKYIKKGDIIAFYRKNKIILHRVLKINKYKESFIAKGDNRMNIERGIRYKNFLGKAVFLKNNLYSYSLDDWKARMFGICLYNKGYSYIKTKKIREFFKSLDFFIKIKMKQILYKQKNKSFKWKSI
jgi:signal peptidase I